jgi:hypothetical protein
MKNSHCSRHWTSIDVDEEMQNFETEQELDVPDSLVELHSLLTTEGI